MSKTSVAALLRKINKAHGEGDTVIVKGVELRHKVLPKCTTGSLSFDNALGGGWPMNQWSELVGDESSGKSTLALKTIAANQALDPNWTAAWVAAEFLPTEWAELLGVDLDRLLIIDTNVMEVAYEIVDELMESREIDCVVIDSYPALIPILEDEKTMDENTVGNGAKRTAQFFRKVGKSTKRSLTEVDRPVLGLFINQWRERIGVMYGDPRTTPGGKAKNYAFFVRVDVKRLEWLESDKHKVGQRIQITSRKNKSAPGQREGLVDFYFDEGGPVPAGQYDTTSDIVNVALATGTISKVGAWYEFDGAQLCKARKDVFTTVEAMDGLAARVSRRVMGVPEPVSKRRHLDQPRAKKTPSKKSRYVTKSA